MPARTNAAAMGAAAVGRARALRSPEKRRDRGATWPSPIPKRRRWRIDPKKKYTATIETSRRHHEGRAVRRRSAEDGQQLRLPGARGLLRRRDLPPRHPRLHDPGRRPHRHRHAAGRATSSTTSRSTRPYKRGTLAMANAGPEHQRQPVLRHARRLRPAARTTRSSASSQRARRRSTRSPRHRRVRRTGRSSRSRSTA